MRSEEADRFSRFEVIDKRWSLTNDRFNARAFFHIPAIVFDAGSLKEAGRSAVAVGVAAMQSLSA